MNKVEIKNISKSFEGKKILDGISLSLDQGEIISLLGPSGCGKSTTLKIISGLMEPDSGDILFNGESVLNVQPEKRGAVIVFQEYLLFPHMNIEENVGFGLKMAKVDKNIIKKKVNEMLKVVQLSGLEKSYPSEISGGQRQRAALARALAVEPKILLLDEPFSNLDQRLREDMREFVLDLQQNLKITTILVTHDKEEALMMSDRIAVMLDGKVQQYAPPSEIYMKPQNSKVADFFGDKNYINGSVHNGVFTCCFGEFKVDYTDNANVNIMIKPEEVYIRSLNRNNNIVGKITKRKYAGDRVYYRISVLDKEIRCTSPSSNLFNVGDDVQINIDFSKAIIYDELND